VGWQTRQKEGSSGQKEKEKEDEAAVVRLTPRGLRDLNQSFPAAESSELLWGLVAFPGRSWLQKGPT